MCASVGVRGLGQRVDSLAQLGHAREGGDGGAGGHVRDRAHDGQRQAYDVWSDGVTDGRSDGRMGGLIGWEGR